MQELAERVQAAGARAGLEVKIDHIKNPRTEKEEHYYNAKHSKFDDLGLKPHLLTDDVLDQMLAVVRKSNGHVTQEYFQPRIKWNSRSEIGPVARDERTCLRIG